MTVKTLLERFAIAIVIGIYLLYGTMDMFRTRYHDYFDLHDLMPFLAELRYSANRLGKFLSPEASKSPHAFRSKGVNHRVQY